MQEGSEFARKTGHTLISDYFKIIQTEDTKNR